MPPRWYQAKRATRTRCKNSRSKENKGKTKKQDKNNNYNQTAKDGATVMIGVTRILAALVVTVGLGTKNTSNKDA